MVTITNLTKVNTDQQTQTTKETKETTLDRKNLLEMTGQVIRTHKEIIAKIKWMKDFSLDILETFKGEEANVSVKDYL